MKRLSVVRSKSANTTLGCRILEPSSSTLVYLELKAVHMQNLLEIPVAYIVVDGTSPCQGLSMPNTLMLNTTAAQPCNQTAL